MPQPKTESLQTGAHSEFTTPRMIRIPAGSFLMGSDAGQDNERPVHRVWVDTVEMAACQVTNAEYGQFISVTGHRKPLHWHDSNFSDPLQPVVAPSWFDAVEYCEWLSRMTQQHFRLPTEAEWEYAARGGLEQKSFPWGDEPPESLANYAARWKTGPEPVGRAETNGYGLCDIGANVHEWCADWFDADYYRVSPEQNPRRRLGGHREGDPGVISRKCRGLPRGQASLRNFSMQITDFVLLAMSTTNQRTSRPIQSSTTLNALRQH